MIAKSKLAVVAIVLLVAVLTIVGVMIATSDPDGPRDGVTPPASADSGEPSDTEPAVEEPAEEDPAAEEPAAEEPAAEEPAVEEPAAEEPAVEEPAVEEPAVEEPTVEEPAVEEPTVEEPAVEEPAVEEPAVEEPAVEEPAEEEGLKAEFIGVDGCKKCHFKQWMSWKKTSMAKSFDVLKPGAAAEAKTKHGLDPASDYTNDASCLPCHTTGYGKPGGYPALVDGKAWSEEESARAAKRLGVQCESCHGPGSLAAPFKKEHPEYSRADLMKLGVRKPDEDSCAVCHQVASPTVAEGYVLDYGKLTKDAAKIHKRVPLKSSHD